MAGQVTVLLRVRNHQGVAVTRGHGKSERAPDQNFGHVMVESSFLLRGSHHMMVGRFPGLAGLPRLRRARLRNMNTPVRPRLPMC